MRYPEKLLYYFHNRRHAGSLSLAQPNVKQVQIGQPNNREIFSLFVDCREGKISMARFQALGSPALIAAGEFICEWLEQKTIVEITELSPEIILNSLGLTAINTHIAHLIISAIKKLKL